MGGGQANSGQASQANNAAMAASAASSKLSDQNAQEQQQQYNYLFGADGKSGSLTPFMDPSSLNVTNPTGVYKTQYTNALQKIGDSYKNARGSLAQNWANRGGSSNAAPSGFEQDQSRQLERDNADANGTAFGTAVGQQYQDALSNFWNANNVASGQAAGARTGALTGAQNSGQTADAIYSTAGQYHPSATAGIIGSGLQAGGQVGAAAMCPARGSKIRTLSGDLKVEDLREGDMLLQRSGEFAPLSSTPVVISGSGVRVITRRGRVSNVNESHAWCVPSGGYIEAEDSKLAIVNGEDEPDTIESVYRTGTNQFYLLSIRGDRTYLCDGLWSLV